MHGWCHWDAWLDRVAEPLGGAQFRPYNAASSLHEAMRGVLAPAWYAAGVLCCIFHLANGIWTMGITWGVWTRPAAQRRADWLCLAFAAGLAVVGTGVLAGALGVDVGEALQDEQRMFDARAAAGEIKSREAAHKRWTHEELQRLHETVLGGGVVAAVEHAPGVAAPAAASWPRANRTGGER
jgi:succinate dehydrogenase / fumarate reductase cytochrome b subunit